MSRYLPIVLGALMIIGLTIPQIVMSDRFSGSNFTAEQQAKLLANVPKEFGDWVGEDMEIKEEVRRTAGAIGAISRTYRNTRTGEQVNLWLIVGHARPVSAHTPNICYAGSGFATRAPEDSLHPFAFQGQPEAPFWTNTFVKEDPATGRQLVRVFWSWYDPMEPGPVRWQAPKNPRFHFGNTRALFKMYFTSQMRDTTETTEDSPCSRFARDFLPIVNEALANVYAEDESGAGHAAGEPSSASESAEPASQEGATEVSDAEPPA